MKPRASRDDILLLDNSIERVINTSIANARFLATRANPRQEAASENLQDWQDLQELVTKLWDNARDEAFKRQMARNEAFKRQVARNLLANSSQVKE